MNTKQWVQHMSGQGEKWQLVMPHEESCHPSSWHAKTPLHEGKLFLPKSEYHLCDAPEVWVDVTEQISNERKDGPYTRWDHVGEWGMVLTVAGNSPYRLRKVKLFTTSKRTEFQEAFIVEKKQP